MMQFVYKTGALLVVLSLAATPVVAQQPYAFGACGTTWEGTHPVAQRRSLYVPMRDGVRLAVDLLLPDSLAPNERVPTVLVMTRYWRAAERSEPSELQRFWARNGYAVVEGDVRGTGASFGTWPHHRSRDETLDFGDVMTWIAAQPWSDGRVVGWGVSYTANTADWMVELNRPSFNAAVSRHPDYDPYAHLYFPGGVPNVWFGRTWGAFVKNLDLNVNPDTTKPTIGVRPVDGDAGKRLIAQAIAARRDVPGVWESLQQITYRDDRPPAWRGWSMDDWGIHHWAARVEASHTPMQSWGGWMDAGTADGVLRRFMTLSNPQRVFVGPWNHGAGEHASPFLAPNAPTDPPERQQHLEDLCFLDGALGRHGVAAASGKLLVYYTMGEERWKSTTTWPLPGTRMQRWHLGDAHTLSLTAPAAATAADRYRVDFEASTGSTNRWTTNANGGDVVYPDRAEQDRRLLTYTSAPFSEDAEFTGHPVVTLHVASTHADGAVFVYLEDVDGDGAVRYLTEGMLRTIHRKVAAANPPYRVLGPYHSFERKDAMPLVPGEMAELSFELLPTSVLVRRGHRVRIAIAGADKGTFRRLPESGDPTLTVHRSRDRASYIELPLVPRP